jgi:DNA-binding beta-propeller fold protein YncE
MNLVTAMLLFLIADPRIGEASGIAKSMLHPGVVYMHNDSGDSARFFALDVRTGRTVATYAVPSAINVDWEDIAVARDRRGLPSVWLADIGDNDARRTEVRIYRVDEPRSPASGLPEVWRLRYPDGPHDAESLAVAPGGTAVIVTKSVLGSSAVYAVPARPGGVQTLRRIGEIRFAFTGTPGGPNIAGQLTATGAAFSRDGTLLAVRTYTDAYLWRVVDGDVAAALHAAPVRVALPPQPQGEGIAVDGSRLLVNSEGRRSAVYAVPLPHVAVRSPSPTPTPRPTSETAAEQQDRDPFPIGIAAAAVAVTGFVIVWLVRRRR